MLFWGQLCLFGAFVGSGFAAFACVAAGRRGYRSLARAGLVAAVTAFAMLTSTLGVLAYGLLTKDFRLSYVAQYSSRSLPWHYSLSALWVGQAGSLLVWSWFTNLLAVVYRLLPAKRKGLPHEHVFGVLMACTCFLIATMVFAADPMAAGSGVAGEGAGLTPLLQHPAMLIHPPVVFLGYAGWSVPFALAVTALLWGRTDAWWVASARRWALFSWAVLGGGILLGALWAYEELGWGGYWGWDPVENGSLIPWLTGTACLHTLMVLQYRGMLKKTALALPIATFGLCNFATFLTRSGIFSSLHAFSESPLGWLFLVLMFVLAATGGMLIFLRRKELHAEQSVQSVWSREAIVIVATIGILLLTAAVCGGTVVAAASKALVGRTIMVGPGFYNTVLMPIAVLTLGATGLAPLLNWGAGPSIAQKKMLWAAFLGGLCIAAGSYFAGTRDLLLVVVSGLVGFSVVCLLAALHLDVRRLPSRRYGIGLLQTLRARRRQYAGFLVHTGFFCLAIGVTGSSVGARQHDLDLGPGETVQWRGHEIKLASIDGRELDDKLIAEARLEVTYAGRSFSVAPAQHFHFLQQQRTTEVAIRSDWRGDFYTILHGFSEDGRASLTLIQVPMIRWLWLGGGIMICGAACGLWPAGLSAVATASLVQPSATAEETSIQRRESPLGVGAAARAAPPATPHHVCTSRPAG